MTGEVAVTLALIGHWQRQFVRAKPSTWRASKEWREACPSCGEPRLDLATFIAHHRTHRRAT